MDSKATAKASAPDPTKAPVQPIAAPAKSEPPVVQGPDPIETRLVIEKDEASGSYIYKTINRMTGEVLQQLPRAEVLRLREASQYAVGTVIRTKA